MLLKNTYIIYIDIKGKWSKLNNSIYEHSGDISKTKVQQHVIKQRDLKAKFILEHWYREQSSIIAGLAPPAKQFLSTSQLQFLGEISSI